MAGSYSMDLRSRVVAAVDDGSSVAVVARRFEVSQTFVRTLLQRRR
jgi:transposase-like protein